MYNKRMNILNSEKYTKLKGTGQGGKVFARIQSICNAYSLTKLTLLKENSNKSIEKRQVKKRASLVAQ